MTEAAGVLAPRRILVAPPPEGNTHTRMEAPGPAIQQRLLVRAAAGAAGACDASSVGWEQLSL